MQASVCIDKEDGKYYLQVHISRLGHPGHTEEVEVPKDVWESLKKVGVTDLSSEEIE